jgi:organic radical activating enzyme
VIEVGQAGIRMTAEELTRQQQLAASHVTFSLTEACPLRCRHCIVNTVPAADHSRTMPLERAQSYAAQLPHLRARGVWLLSFTGGEPFVASRQLRLLSDAAAAAGMHSTVVTACHWAATESSASATVANFPGIMHWQLSADVFHEEFVSWQNVVRAALAVTLDGRDAMVRMAASIPLSEQHLDLHRRIRQSLPENVPIVVQPITLNGRGASIQTEIPRASVPGWPCVPNGMVIRFDGTISPCCAGLVDQREGHPFQYANADQQGLAGAHQAWCTDPLLQLIRTAGFAPVLAWVREMAPEHEVLRATPEHPCECCVRLWKNPSLGSKLRERAALPENREKIAQLTEAVFGEVFMKQSLGDEDHPELRSNL